RLREGALGWLFTSATLRQAAFALLLIALSVAATVIYLKRGEKKGNEVAVVTAHATPTPLSTAGPTPTPSPVASPSNGANLDQTTKPNNGSVTPKGGQPAAVPQRSPRNAPASQSPAARISDQELMNQQIARAGREYQKAIKMLDQAIAKRRDSLDPAL